ncbi:hypothetical protein C0Q70_03360 [Pomacea canaliculata]|uniref:Uncharacterized protein n=1 Tax=Pomacea canaliculata TaxID=400727 RepID=A0A2T7PSH8_POMCA|nr:hypothetical protein C0Q70_03360 [Pomacea canaliculata]
MEVCTKAAIDRKSTDRFSDSRNHRASEGLRFLKDDVWLSGDRQERFGSICNHLGRQHGGVEQRPRLVAAPSPWLSGIATDEKTGREENESAEDSGLCSDAFLPRTSCNQCGHASSLQSRNWPELLTQTTAPGTSRSKNDPPAFGYLDPSAMMGEYLHNYRNFLMDLRMAMRRGKNYESQIICGPLPPHQLPRPQSLPQQANSQQESRQHPHISELSPGLWSVLAEIASPQPQDLRMEFSRLMNVVTSLRMREIWTDKKQHHQQQQQQHQQQHARPAPQGHVTYSRHGFSLPDPVGHRRGVSESEDKSFFSTATSARRHEADEDCIDDILAMTSILTTMNVQSDSSGNSDAASFLSSFPASPLSLSARDPALGSRYLPGIQKNYERLQNSFVPCSNSRVRAGPTYALEEEEEQEEKQRMQLLIYQLEQSQKQAPVPGESHVVEGQEVSDPLRETRDLEESGGSCQASADNEVSCPDALEEAQQRKTGALRPPEVNGQPPPQPGSTAKYRSHRGLLLYYLSSSSSFTSFSHAFHKWQKAYQTESRASSDDGDERLSGLTVYVTPALGSFASPLPLHPSEQEGMSEVSELKYRLNVDKKTSFSSSLANAVEDDDEEFSAGHFLTEEECFENTNDNDKYVYNSPKMGALLKNTGGKIRILGSKSYAEVYSESAALLYPDDASMGDKKKDKECSPARAEGKDTEEKGKAEQGGQKDSKKKPVVVSVRPLSHATRRSAHSYLTQAPWLTPSTDAAQGTCQQAPPGEGSYVTCMPEHRQGSQSTKGTEAEGGGSVGQSQCSQRAESNSDEKQRAAEILATHSTHETVPNTCVTFGQNSQGQRRSASDSDVLHKGDANSIFQLADQSTGAGDSAAAFSMFATNIVYPSLTFQHQLIAQPHSLQGSSIKSKSSRLGRRRQVLHDPLGSDYNRLMLVAPHLPVPKTVSFSATPLHPCPHLMAGSVTSLIAARDPLPAPGPDLSAEGKIEWKLAKRQDRLEAQGAHKIYDNNQSVDEFSSKEKAASAVAVTGLSTAQTGFFNCKPVKLCGQASSVSDDLSSMESADEVDVSLNDINFCVGPTLEILNNTQSKHSTFCLDRGSGRGSAATLAELAIVQDRKLVLQEDAEYFYSHVAAAALSPKSRSISDRELHTHSEEGLATSQAQVCLHDAHNADKYTASRLSGGQSLESEARNIRQKSAATEDLMGINRLNKEFTSAPVKPGWLPLSSLLHSYYPPCKRN